MELFLLREKENGGTMSAPLDKKDLELFGKPELAAEVEGAE